MEELIHSGAVSINKKKSVLEESNKLRECHKLDDFLKLGAPETRVAYNVPFLDKLNIKQYLLMKLACVIGE